MVERIAGATAQGRALSDRTSHAAPRTQGLWDQSGVGAVSEAGMLLAARMLARVLLRAGPAAKPPLQQG
jgi:hypothetical protein